MTLPSSLSELDSEPDDEHDYSRITVLVGGLLLDVGLPSRVSVSELANDVIDLANDQPHAHGGTANSFDNGEGRWTFAQVAGESIAPERTLAEAGVYDGDLLVVREVGAPASSVLVDDVECGFASIDPRARWYTGRWPTTAWFVLSITLATATALMLELPD